MAPATRMLDLLDAADARPAELPPDGCAFDLVACRNVLIEPRPGLRRRVESVLLASIAPGGLLWLGEAELPGHRAGGLEVVDHEARLFRRVPAGDA